MYRTHPNPAATAWLTHGQRGNRQCCWRCARESAPLLTQSGREQAEWDTADMGELRVPIMSPSSFLRGTTVRGDLHMSDTLPPSEQKPRSGSDANLGEGRTRGGG